MVRDWLEQKDAFVRIFFWSVLFLVLACTSKGAAAAAGGLTLCPALASGSLTLPLPIHPIEGCDFLRVVAQELGPCHAVYCLCVKLQQPVNKQCF